MIVLIVSIRIFSVNFAPSPQLEYLYPRPDSTIITNIMNALIAVPKFYTQVLHLMNKLNLPPPFGAPTATPPLVGSPIGKAVALIFVSEKKEEEARSGRLGQQWIRNRIGGRRRNRQTQVPFVHRCWLFEEGHHTHGSLYDADPSAYRRSQRNQPSDRATDTVSEGILRSSHPDVWRKGGRHPSIIRGTLASTIRPRTSWCPGTIRR